MNRNNGKKNTTHLIVRKSISQLFFLALSSFSGRTSKYIATYPAPNWMQWNTMCQTSTEFFQSSPSQLPTTKTKNDSGGGMRSSNEKALPTVVDASIVLYFYLPTSRSFRFH